MFVVLSEPELPCVWIAVSNGGTENVRARKKDHFRMNELEYVSFSSKKCLLYAALVYAYGWNDVSVSHARLLEMIAF
uniref:Uncharacterized protein n=1 Tax=Thermosporothrix sp. COM3 TaxID=2490863 RepID=A0A455SJR4_9CHLR|nr:hypothetical protein KTC_25910 [Thermosporothrix sp. COM3]